MANNNNRKTWKDVRHHTKEAKIKISKALKGKIVSIETRKKLS